MSCVLCCAVPVCADVCCFPDLHQVFVPVVPLLESSQQSAPQPAETGLILPVAQRSTSADSPLLRSDDVNLLLDGHGRSCSGVSV